LVSSGVYDLKIEDYFNVPINIHVYNKVEGTITFSTKFVSTTDFVGSTRTYSKLFKSYDNVKDKLRPKYPTYKYDDIVHHIHTGDIILFHGIEAHSKLIESGCLSYWSHAAILIRNPSNEIKEIYGVKSYHTIAENAGTPIEEDPKHDVYVLESDYSTIDKRIGGGCQLVPLKAWLIDYESYYKRMYCVIRRLVLPGRHPTDNLNFPNLENWLKETSVKAYKNTRRQVVGAAIKWNKEEDLSSVFCSELVAATLKRMELIKKEINCTNMAPKDFDRITYQQRRHINHFGKDDFELERGGTLMEPFRIVFNLAKYTPKVHSAVSLAPTFVIKQE